MNARQAYQALRSLVDANALRANVANGAAAGLRNRGTVGGTVSPTTLDTIAPDSEAIVAAANVTRTASGLFIAGCTYAVDPTAADTIELGIASAPGTTGWSGGTLSTDGTWRINASGAVVATSSGSASQNGGQEGTLPGAGSVTLNVATLCDLSGLAVGSKGLIIALVLHSGSGSLTSAILGKTFFYELP